MKKLKEYWMIILLALCFIGVIFYWHEWRPAQIRIACGYKTAEMANKATSALLADQIGAYMEICLMKNGLNK